MICNHGVAGSSPAAGTNKFKHLAQPARLGFVFYGTLQHACNRCVLPFRQYLIALAIICRRKSFLSSLDRRAPYHCAGRSRMSLRPSCTCSQPSALVLISVCVPSASIMACSNASVRSRGIGELFLAVAGGLPYEQFALHQRPLSTPFTWADKFKLDCPALKPVALG